MTPVNSVHNLWIFTTFLSLFAGTIWASPPLRYMVYSCQKGESLYVNQSLILELTTNLDTDRKNVGHLHCAVDIIVQPQMRIFLHFISLDISDDTKTPDRFHIYDYTPSGTRQRLTPPTGLYGILERPYYPFNTAGIKMVDYKSSGRRLRLDYLGKPTLIHEGFKILITTFKESNGGANCGSGWFACPFESICIPLSTRCDGNQNCGQRDSGDEQLCHPMEHVVANVEESVLQVAITGTAAFVVFLIIVVVVYLVVRRTNNKRYRKNRGLRLANETVAAYSRDDETARLYAPPSYEDVVNISEDTLGPPPEYSSVRFNDPRKYRFRPGFDRNPSTSIEVAVMHSVPESQQKSLRHDHDNRNDSDAESDLGLSPDSGVSMTRDSESDLAKQELTTPSFKLIPIKTDNSECQGSAEVLSLDTQSGSVIVTYKPKYFCTVNDRDNRVLPKSGSSGNYQNIHGTIQNDRLHNDAEISI